MTHHGTQEHDFFGDLPIAKWLNNRPTNTINQPIDSFYHTELRNGEIEKNEIMSIASDLNHYNLNEYNTSNAISIDSYCIQDIEQLSISLQFWSINTMKCYFSKWKNHTVNKLNILHIKYRNYQYVHHRKILFEYFKKWQILQQNYASTIMSLSHWVHSVQSNYFKEWQKYTFQTAPKSRIILCNRIKQFLCFWRDQTQRINALSNHYHLIINKNKLLQLKIAWIKWLFLQKYHTQIVEIKQVIIKKNRRQCIANTIQIWREMYCRYRKLKQLKLQIICKQFYLWWQLQASLSIHYKHIYNHSLDQSSRNAFAYWYRKRLHKVFKRWRYKQLYIESLKLKTLQCTQFHTNNTRKLYYKQWEKLYWIITKQRIIIITNYLNYWREYKDTQNVKRQNMLESQMLYSRNILLKWYTFWRIETKQCIHNRLTQEKANTFYKSNIIKKHIQIVFGQWLLITIQQKDIKLKIETKYKHNLSGKYWCIWILQYQCKQMIRRFQLKWNKTKHYDLYLKIFISWKKQCKYQISLLDKKREIQHHKRHKIFRSWYLTVYKRHKLMQCQVIAQKCSIQSSFIRWKVTMKHHLVRKRNEIYLRNKHQNSEMIQILIYWREYVRHKQNITCKKITLNKVCDTFILEKGLREWHYSYQLLLGLKSAKQHHIHNTLRVTIRYWLHYNRHRQKHQYMLHVALHQHHKTVLINVISYWKHETMSNLSLKSRTYGFTTTLHTKHKSIAFKRWNMHHLRQTKLMDIKSKIQTQREIQIISTLFYGWFDKSEEKRTLRLLNDHAIGLHKDKVLTRIFLHWIKMLPLLKRERVQLMKPRLIFNFYRWRKWSAYNNNLRDKYYVIVLRSTKRYFSVYREYVECNQEQRKKGHIILNVVHTLHKTRIGLNLWREITNKHKQDNKKYTMIKHKNDSNKRTAIINEWKLLYQVSVFAKSKQLRYRFKIWRKEYGYRQIEARIMYNIYYHGIKKYTFNQWRKLWMLQLNQRKSFELMLQNTNTKQRGYFFGIWRIQYKLRLLHIRSNRTHITMRINFWRIYSMNRIKMSEDLSKLKNELTDKWQFHPSSIYEYHYSDEDDDDDSMLVAPILGKRKQLNELKSSYNRPTTPTLLSISHKHNYHDYNISKDDMFVDHHILSNKLIGNIDYLIKPTKKQIIRQILLKWKYFVAFKAFKRWKNMVQIKKEEKRLIQFAEYEFRQKSLEYVICIWKHRVNVNKIYKILNHCNSIKQMRFTFNIWHRSYKYELHYERCTKQKCVSYWNGIIIKRKTCDTAFTTISTNKPIHTMRNSWNQWYRLFLFINQIRNDNDNSDIYYYRLLIRNYFDIWNRSFVTKSIIVSLVDNAWSLIYKDEKRKELEHLNDAFKIWLNRYQELKRKSNIALEMYVQNTLKHYFDHWKDEFFERYRNLKYKMCSTLIFWKYMTHSNKDLAIKELIFYHSHLLPNIFILWKQYTQNKRISTKYYYYKTLQKYMKHWKVYNKERQRIYNNIDKNFKNMKMQRIKYQMNGWKCFALKCTQINEIAVILIQKRKGIKFLSTNNLSMISFKRKPNFKIIQNEAKLLQNQAFDRWRYFYDRNQKIKYFFRLIRLERFIAEWRDYTKLENKNKYLMSKVPIIAKNTSMKNHFNLWIKTFKKHQTLRNIYHRVSNRQQFNLMKNMFLSFRFYIYNEKRKRFILKRLRLCKYIRFWSKRAKEQNRYNNKENELNHKYKLKLKMEAITQWKAVFKDSLLSFHFHEFQLSYSRSYYLQIWRNINIKNKIKLFRNNQCRQEIMQCIDKWKGFIITKNKIAEMQQIAMDYYSINIYCNVWNIWNQRLFDKYILINAQSILKTFHVQYLLKKWRIYTESKQICKTACKILCDYQRKLILYESFGDWRKHCIAKTHYQIFVLKQAFRQWRLKHIDALNIKHQQNMMKQILFVWYNYTRNSIQYDQEKIHGIQSKQLLRHFRLWIKTMELKQHLFQVYMDASRYHINNLILKGIIAFKDHRTNKKLQQQQYECIKALRCRILIKNAMDMMLYQWFCVKKAITFNIKCQSKQKLDLFSIWYLSWIQIKKEQKRLEIGEYYWRNNKLRIAINDWLLISRRHKQYKKYLINAENKHNRKLYNQIFVFWYESFKNISCKKQKLFESQLSWNKRKRNYIFISWNNTAKAHCHYKLRYKSRCIISWKLLYQYHIAARYERQKNIYLCLNIFNKWNKFTSNIKHKEIKLNELFEIFVDWKKEKLFVEWRNIYYKQQRATQLYALNIEKRIFKMYISCVQLSYIEKEKDIESADNYYKFMTIKRFYYFWIQRYERIVKTNHYFNTKCNKCLVQRRKKTLRSQFKHWLLLFHHHVNERRDIHISAQYHNNYVLSKIFVEWKLFVKTKRYKNKLITKSLSSLKQSMIKNNGFRNKISLSHNSHSYIRLSNQSSIFSRLQNEERYSDEDYDSVLIKSPILDSYE